MSSLIQLFEVSVYSLLYIYNIAIVTDTVFVLFCPLFSNCIWVSYQMQISGSFRALSLTIMNEDDVMSNDNKNNFNKHNNTNHFINASLRSRITNTLKPKCPGPH